MSLRDDAATGFTLLELMVVVAIVGILSGLSIVTFGRQLQKERLKEASRDATTWLQDLQAKAIQQNKICEIVIDAQLGTATSLAGQESSLEPGDRCDDIGSYRFKVSIDSLTSDGQSSSTCPLAEEEGRLRITYTARGTLPCGGEIMLIGADGLRKRCIHLSAPLGVIREGPQRGETCDYTSAY